MLAPYLVDGGSAPHVGHRGKLCRRPEADIAATMLEVVVAAEEGVANRLEKSPVPISNLTSSLTGGHEIRGHNWGHPRYLELPPISPRRKAC
jgi:hypothetical protein